MTEETAIITYEEIAKYLGWSRSKLMARRNELKEAGVVFLTWRGRPPHRSKVACCFPSILQRWIILKSTRGEII